MNNYIRTMGYKRRSRYKNKLNQGIMLEMIAVGEILSYAVQKLGDFLIQQAKFLEAVEENAKWLKNELEYMQAFVDDAEQNQDGDHRVKQWVSDVKRIAEDTVAVVDSFNDDGASSGFGFMVPVNRKRKREPTRYSIGKEIESLKARVLELSSRRVRYGINNISGERNKIRRLRRVPSYVEDEVVVGLEDEAKRIIGQLLTEEPRRCIVSVYGMGGLGKTTLARMVYNSATVDAKFVCRAWVCVTQEWSTEDLLRSILRSFQKGFMSNEAEMVGKMGVADLERYLRQYLESRKYLVVVDDLWHREAWESLKRALPDRQNGSRVIITTRKEEIAARADRRSFPLKLRFLTPEESWNLFCNKASPTGEWSPAMANLGREMVGKCGGLPRAITVLGGLLSYQRGLEKWQEVRAQIWDRLKEDSVEIHELLSLSYHDLSPNLKSCFC